MKIVKRMLLGFLLIIVLLIGCVYIDDMDTDGEASLTEEENLTAEENSKEEERLKEEASLSGEGVAPDFTAKMVDGSTFVLSEAKGSVVILNFWATWCGPCCEELPAFQKLHEEYGDELKVLAVDYAESENVVNEFLSANGYSFPVAYDVNAKIADLYPSDGIPYTLIIDEEGIIQKTFIGARSADEQYELYKNAIEEALND